MFEQTPAFASFSVDNIDKARDFYGGVLGVETKDGEMGTLQLVLKGGGEVMIYPKDNHEAASYTVLNFVVEDIDKVVKDLSAKGVEFVKYDNEMMHQDDSGIARGKAAKMGPDIAWMLDPAGNTVAVLEG